MSYTLEKVMRIYDDSEGVYLEVRQNPDFPNSGLEIHTNDDSDNERWFGKINLPLNSKEQVLKLAQALTEMAEQIK